MTILAVIGRDDPIAEALDEADMHGVNADEAIEEYATLLAKVAGLEASNQQLRGAVDALDEAIKAARLFNRSGMTWREYDRKLVEWERLVNRTRGQS